jgi:hypothetical protein
MSADSCIFCLELLSKATDRNLVDGKGKWGLELVDFPFVVQSVSPYICKAKKKNMWVSGFPTLPSFWTSKSRP